MADFKRISINEAQQMIDSQQVAIVDVRDAQSYQQAHIDGACHLDNNTIEPFLTATEKHMPVIVYCYHGNSSQQAAQYLVQQGFENVSSMDGGFEAWRVK
jgi:thiosulfate sulfurtransferase